MHSVIPTPTLSYNRVRLEPLTLQHEAALRQAVQDGGLWRLAVTSAPEPHAVADYIRTALDTRVAFAVTDEETGRLVGTTAYCNIAADVGRLEIGYTWYAQSVWRSRINTTCKFLLLQYAFETLGYAAVRWQTDILNTRSQAAIERLGAKKDGILRCDRIRKDGTVRDTVVYSMLANEWDAAKQHLSAHLAAHAAFQAA